MLVSSIRFFATRLVLAALLCAVALGAFLPFAPRAYADGPCTERGDNLTRNGSVTDGGYDTAHGVVANSWNAFLINGDWPAFDLADNESANGDIGGSSSQYIHGDGTRFDSGIYQVIAGVQPGASYEFSVGWAAMLRDTGGGHNEKFDNVIIRRVGYDATGGTDPQSVNVHWGPEVGTGSSGRSLNHPDMRITFRALAAQVTVFVRVYNLSSSASDKVFFDVMCLLPRGDIPVEAVEPTQTPTPLATDVPTARPTRIPPTDVPATDTPLPPTLTPLPAEAHTATPVSVAVVNEQGTPEVRRVIPRSAGSTSSGGGSDNADSAGSSGSGGSGGSSALSFAVIAGSIGVIGLGLLGILLIGGFAVWRIFIRQVDDALDPTYDPTYPPDDPTQYR